jgi:hypothetical protein
MSASASSSSQPRAVSARHGSWPQIRILVLLALVSLPAVTSRIYASDEVQYFSFLRSLWFDRDVSFENEYQHFYDAGVARDYNFHETFLERSTETGRRVSFATIGSALLWAPFYAVADVGVVMARAAGSAIPRDGYSWPYVAAVCYGSAIYGIAALLLAIRAAGMIGLDTPQGVLAALAVWIGTPLLFYTHLAPAMAHATSAFAVSLFVVVWLHVRREWTFGGGLALGAAGALMVMVREQDVTFFAAPAIDLALRVVKNPQERLRRAVAATIGAGLACGLTFLPQAFAYLALNGRFGPSRLVSRKMNWLSPHAWGILASPEHGFFLWTPLALVALAGLVILARRLWRGLPWPGHVSLPVIDPRGVALGLCAAFVAQVYLLGSLDSWTSAGAFGQRRFVSSTILFVIGVTAIIAVLERLPIRRLSLAVVGVLIWWNVALMAEFATHLMDRQRLELGRNAYDAFVTVPAMVPRLAYRYVFDRSSFYREPTVPPPDH